MTVDFPQVLLSLASAGLGVVGFFLVRTLNHLDGTLEKLGDRVANHDTRLAVLESKIET